jgi:hypothetical protein
MYIMASRLIGFCKTDYLACELRAKSTEKVNVISTTVNTIGCATARVGIKNSIADYDELNN